jgi:hypothetical protein
MKLPTIGWVYCFYCFAFPWRFKIRIARDYRARRVGVQHDLTRAMNMPVKVRVALAVPSLFRESQEARLHGWLRPFSASMPHHAGYTEWFWGWMPNAAGALFCAAVWALAGGSVNPWAVVAAALLPVPVVPALLVAALLVVEVVIISTFIVAVLAAFSFTIQFFVT